MDQHYCTGSVQHYCTGSFRCTEAVLLHTSYHQILSHRMVWENRGDRHNPFIADNIRCDTFEAVLMCLHFRDNTLIDSGRT